MKRGEIWYATLPRPMGGRPVLLLSRPAVYDNRGSVTVAHISTRIRGIDSEVLVGSDEGLQQQSVVILDSINTYPKGWMRRQIGDVAPLRMAEIERAIHYALALTA